MFPTKNFWPTLRNPSSFFLHAEFTMPSNRLNKVQKHITKKKGKNPTLHENSRDNRRLQSAAQRDDKLNRLAAVREKQNRPYCKDPLCSKSCPFRC